MKRNIDLDGATNFRDLGGYEASNGSKIKKGLVFRSDHLSNLTIEDINILKELGIKTICDFRSDVELIENPSLFDLTEEDVALQLANGLNDFVLSDDEFTLPSSFSSEKVLERLEELGKDNLLLEVTLQKESSLVGPASESKVA